jgi:hypothetical protein
LCDNSRKSEYHRRNAVSSTSVGEMKDRIGQWTRDLGPAVAAQGHGRIADARTRHPRRAGRQSAAVASGFGASSGVKVSVTKGDL